MVIILNHCIQNSGKATQISVRNIRNEMQQFAGCSLSVRQTQRQLHDMQEKGLINRKRCDRDKRLPGTLAQVTYYEIPDLWKALRGIIRPVNGILSLPVTPACFPIQIHEKIVAGRAAEYCWRL